MPPCRCKAVPEVVDEVDDSARFALRYGSLPVENGMVINSLDDSLLEVS